MVTWLGATCLADCTALYYIYIYIYIKYHIIFTIVLFHTPVTVAYFMHLSIVLVSTLSRVSFLLLYIICMLYIVAILSLVLVRETK